MLSGEVVTITKSKDGFAASEKRIVHFKEVPVKSIHLSSMTGDGVMIGCDSLARAPQEYGTLWILFKDDVLLAASVADVLDYENAGTVLPRHVSCTLTSVSLRDGGKKNEIRDAVACCALTPSLLDITANLNADIGKVYVTLLELCVFLLGFDNPTNFFTSPTQKINILACGSFPYPLAFYSLGSTSGKPRGFRQIARQAAHALKVTAVSFLGAFIGSTQPAEEEKTVVSLEECNGLRDDRRSINSVTLDPSLKYALCSDNFGRVLLVDVETNMVVRLWKGVREAQCGWIQERKDDRSSPMLYICIYSPKRGFVEIFSALHGPKIRTITVGIQARLLTTVALASSATVHTLSVTAAKSASLSTCAILRVNSSNNDAKMEVFKLDHIPPASSTVDSVQKLRSEVAPMQAPLSLKAASSDQAVASGEGKEIFGQDIAFVQNIAVIVESVQDGSVGFREVQSDALALFRRLKTTAGVTDASMLLTALCTVHTTFNEHLKFLVIQYIKHVYTTNESLSLLF
jgi:hypothetical protein